MPIFGDTREHLAQTVIEPLRRELEELRRTTDTLHRMFPQTEDLNAIAGRRMYYTAVARNTITNTGNGSVNNPLTIQVPRDGFFVMTHYPVLMWKVTTSGTATDVGKWRPVSSNPLPDQIVNTDFLDISYTLKDAGPERFMQNDTQTPALSIPPAVLPGLLSTPDNMIALPLPAKFDPGSVIVMNVRFEKFTWTAVTAGQMVVMFPGYKIVFQ